MLMRHKGGIESLAKLSDQIEKAKERDRRNKSKYDRLLNRYRALKSENDDLRRLRVQDVRGDGGLGFAAGI